MAWAIFMLSNRIIRTSKDLFAGFLLGVLFAAGQVGQANPVADNVGKEDSKAACQSTPRLYPVKVEVGRRRTISGALRSYTIYSPQPSSQLPHPPFPAVIMIHGFFMSGAQQSNNAKYMAERGIVVMLPNLTRILWGDKNRMRNIKDILDQISWLKKQSQSSKSYLSHLIDPDLIGIAGNSSGGSVVLELIIQAQRGKVPIQSVCSMEGLPWDRSEPEVPKLQPVKILSLRAESSICNEHESMLRCFHSLTFPFDDVKIIGAHHCDAENPTTLRCMCICGKSKEHYRLMFQRLAYLFCRDALNAPRINGEEKSFKEVVRDWEKDGKVTADLGIL